MRSLGGGRPLSALTPASDEPIEVDCGIDLLWQGERPSPARLTCFLDALAAGQLAQVQIVTPSVEGTLVPITYRGASTDKVEVFTDFRNDRYGTGRVEYQTCVGPRVGEDGHFSFDQCTGPAS